MKGKNTFKKILGLKALTSEHNEFGSIKSIANIG